MKFQQEQTTCKAQQPDDRAIKVVFGQSAPAGFRPHLMSMRVTDKSCCCSLHLIYAFLTLKAFGSVKLKPENQTITKTHRLKSEWMWPHRQTLTDVKAVCVIWDERLLQ